MTGSPRPPSYPREVEPEKEPAPCGAGFESTSTKSLAGEALSMRIESRMLAQLHTVFLHENRFHSQSTVMTLI